VWAVTCTFHYWLMKTVMGKPKAFNRVFMIQTTAKLLLYVTFVAITLTFNKNHVVEFVIHFFVVYIIFAIFEVSLILKYIKKSDAIEKHK